eukprot:10523352-Heterocapsa_arctica.AAC.1
MVATRKVGKGHVAYFGHYNACDAAPLVRDFLRSEAKPKTEMGQADDWWGTEDALPPSENNSDEQDSDEEDLDEEDADKEESDENKSDEEDSPDSGKD